MKVDYFNIKKDKFFKKINKINMKSNLKIII